MAVAVALGAGNSAAKPSNAPMFGVAGSRITLNGRTFFPIISQVYSLPDARWVADNSALGVNALLWGNGGCPRDATSAAQVRAVLQGALLWVTKAGACPTAAEIPEAVELNPAIRIIGGSIPWGGVKCHGVVGNTATNLFHTLLLASQQKPTIYRTDISREIVPGRKSCTSGADVRVAFWTAVAAGVAGLEFMAFVPGYEIDPNVVMVEPDVRAAAATFAARLKALEPMILNGMRLPGLGIASKTTRFGAWRFKGATYVVAVNSGATRALAKIRVAGLKAMVLWESKTLRLADGVLLDELPPYGVRLYRVT